jgi:hypothetical protein
MSWPGWAALLAGVLGGALASTSLEGIQKKRLASTEAPLADVDQRLRELAPVQAPVARFEAAREHFDAQVRWIEEERARQRCPGPVLAELDLGRRAPLVERVALEGAMLAVVGRAESDADVKALASAVREEEGARSASAASRPRRSGGVGLRFGLLASVELPPCRAPEMPVPAREKER